jgi:hypothetical protein
LIALLIKCFSAQTYFVNAKIIASLQEDDIGEDESGHHSFLSSSSNFKRSILSGNQKLYSVSDVLFELEQVKKELYN